MSWQLAGITFFHRAFSSEDVSSHFAGGFFLESRVATSGIGLFVTVSLSTRSQPCVVSVWLGRWVASLTALALVSHSGPTYSLGGWWSYFCMISARAFQTCFISKPELLCLNLHPARLQYTSQRDVDSSVTCTVSLLKVKERSQFWQPVLLVVMEGCLAVRGSSLWLLRESLCVH